MLSFRSLIKSTVLSASVMGLVACGGGGSDGYYNQTPSTGGGSSNGGGTGTNTTSANSFLETLQNEGKFLFGALDVTDDTQTKGYIDHAMDTFGNGPLEISLDARKAFKADPTQFTYYANCMSEGGAYYNTGCYVLVGDDTDTTLKDVLNSVSNNKYADWDFDVNDSELSGMKLDEDQIDQFTGKTLIIIFENRNADKNLNDVWVTGVFGYPYKQSWGLTQSDQLRIVSMNTDDSEYNVTVTYDDQTSETKGAISIYNDPTTTTGEKLYVIQNQSAFSVLMNDNPNTPEVEIVSFTIGSNPGSEIATLRMKSNGTEVLDLPSIIALNGNRLENEEPSTNQLSFAGSIHMEAEDIFKFAQSATGAELVFNYVLTMTDSESNSSTYTVIGTSTKTSSGVSTTLTSPINTTYEF